MSTKPLSPTTVKAWNDLIPKDGRQPQVGMNAAEQLSDNLLLGERVEAVVFGDFSDWDESEGTDLIPPYKRGVLLTFDEALGLMTGWSLDMEREDFMPGRFTVWTDQRILFVGCYDGSHWITSMPRNPTPFMPHAVGGG